MCCISTSIHSRTQSVARCLGASLSPGAQRLRAGSSREPFRGTVRTVFGNACDGRSVGCVRSVLGEVCPVTLRGSFMPNPGRAYGLHFILVSSGLLQGLALSTVIQARSLAYGLGKVMDSNSFFCGVDSDFT